MRSYKYTGQNGVHSGNVTMRGSDPIGALNSLAHKASLRVLFFSKRPEFFNFSDIVDENSASLSQVQGFSSEEDLLECDDRFDLAIVCNNVFNEHLIHAIIKRNNLADLVVAWTYDNHHHPDWNRTMTAFSDVVLPSHAFAENVFYSENVLLGKHFPCATGQWSRNFARANTNLSQRSDRLFGGYMAWPMGNRNSLLRQLISAVPNSALKLIEPADRANYFGRSLPERFAEWSSYKIHLALPLLNDIPCRLFDSLICGQIPIVPHDCLDLDSVISRSDQERLPIIRFSPNNIDSIIQAYELAVRRFDEERGNGVIRRRDYAIANHHAAVRIGQIASYLHTASRNGCKSTVSFSDNEVQWRIDPI